MPDNADEFHVRDFSVTEKDRLPASFLRVKTGF